MSRAMRERLTPAEIARIEQRARVQRFLAEGDDVTPAERLSPHHGAAPSLGWLVFGIAMTFLVAFALPDLIAWIHSWSAP